MPPRRAAAARAAPARPAGPLVGTTPVISMPSTKKSASTLQDVADLGGVGQQPAGDGAARLLGPGCPPRPRPVLARAGELDVDPAGHAGAAPLVGPKLGGGGSAGVHRVGDGLPPGPPVWPRGQCRRPPRGATPEAMSARVVASSTSRRATRVAIHTRWSSAAAPSYSASSGGVPCTSASGPSTARMMSATDTSAAGRASQ